MCKGSLTIFLLAVASRVCSRLSTKAASAALSKKAPPSISRAENALVRNEEPNGSLAGIELVGDPSADFSAFLGSGPHQRHIGIVIKYSFRP